MERIVPDNKSVSIWKNHLQEEIDASYLYKILADMEKDEKQQDIYSRLSEVEKKHIKVWRDLLLKHNIILKDDKPSFKAKSLVWLADKFGSRILSKALMNEEAEEVKSYLKLHKTSNSNILIGLKQTH